MLVGFGTSSHGPEEPCCSGRPSRDLGSVMVSPIRYALRSLTCHVVSLCRARPVALSMAFILRETNVVLRFVGGLIIYSWMCTVQKRARPGGARSWDTQGTYQGGALIYVSRSAHHLIRVYARCLSSHQSDKLIMPPSARRSAPYNHKRLNYS
jgi:hypothetical protein